MPTGTAQYISVIYWDYTVCLHMCQIHFYFYMSSLHNIDTTVASGRPATSILCIASCCSPLYIYLSTMTIVQLPSRAANHTSTHKAH